MNQIIYPPPDWEESEKALSLHQDEGKNVEMYELFAAIRSAWQNRFDPPVERNGQIRHNGDTPFSSGVQDFYDGKCFRLRGHDYGREDISWNLVWRDIAFSWYKHSNRILQVNRFANETERAEMLREITEEIATIKDQDILDGKTGLSYYQDNLKRGHRIAPEPTLDDLKKINQKILNNSHTGAFAVPGKTYLG